MKKLDLRVIPKLLTGLLNGTLKLQVTPTGKKAKLTVAPTKRRGKPGRPAAPKRRGRKPLVKKVKISAKKSLRPAKVTLPTPREIFVFLNDKLEGVRLTDLAKHFALKRTQLKKTVAKLVETEKIADLKGRLFLQHRLRKIGTPKEKRDPINPESILKYLKEKGKATLSQMTKDFGETGYQRFNKVISQLIHSDKVRKDDKLYSLIN